MYETEFLEVTGLSIEPLAVFDVQYQYSTDSGLVYEDNIELISLTSCDAETGEEVDATCLIKIQIGTIIDELLAECVEDANNKVRGEE